MKDYEEEIARRYEIIRKFHPDIPYHGYDLECEGKDADHPDCQTKSATEQLITERGQRYGKFEGGAEIMRSLKSVMHGTDGWQRLTASQKEALDMIQHKIGRVLNGDPNYDDNWKDIAGYATLVVNEIQHS